MRELSTVAAYRDRWHITGQSVFGKRATCAARNRQVNASGRRPQRRGRWLSAAPVLSSRTFRPPRLRSRFKEESTCEQAQGRQGAGSWLSFTLPTVARTLGVRCML
jgi:hypothetical protein